MIDDLRLAGRHLRGAFPGQVRLGGLALLGWAAAGSTLLLAAIAVFLALEPVR